jgi:CheY-like chemotaxis protein
VAGRSALNEAKGPIRSSRPFAPGRTFPACQEITTDALGPQAHSTAPKLSFPPEVCTRHKRCVRPWSGGGLVTPITIVIADDYADYRLLVRFLLTSLSDKISIVGEAADGEEALALVRRERPDIVISDLLMPRLNGLDLTTRIKNERPQTKVILMTSYAEACQRVAHVSEADAVVNKLGLHGGLLPAVRDVMVQC